MSRALPETTSPDFDHTTLREVLEGLSRRPKRLPCKLLYDELGSRLFERICELPEYYLTRTELGILRDNAAEMARAVGSGALVIEFGSGTSLKTRVLLDALERPRAYVPVDISASALAAGVAGLWARYPALEVHPVCADYTRELVLPKIRDFERVVVFFPGSTIGNFDRAEALDFLHRVHDLCEQQGLLLIGVDLEKDRATLEAAYDDRQGVTAEFNRNVLRVVNRTCSARFPLDGFAHRALYEPRFGRVEMHLVSRCAQEIEVGPRRIAFGDGEPIVTEHCYKYALADFCDLARAGGFEPARVWTDPGRLFGVLLLRTIGA